MSLLIMSLVRGVGYSLDHTGTFNNETIPALYVLSIFSEYTSAQQPFLMPFHSHDLRQYKSTLSGTGGDVLLGPQLKIM